MTLRILSLALLPVVCLSSAADWEHRGVRDLHNAYGEIFKYGNRNAASHLWSTYLLDKAKHLSAAKLEELFGGFCAVSGSPVNPGDWNRYRLNLQRAPPRSLPQLAPPVPAAGAPEAAGTEAAAAAAAAATSTEVALPAAADGGATPPGDSSAHSVRGYMQYCCWPCVCDTQDFIRIDTKTIMTRDGPKAYHFAVLGNPCDHEDRLHVPFVQPFDQRETTLAREAAEVRCDAEGKLIGATLSDNGFTIITMFFDEKTFGELPHQDETVFEGVCKNRADNGYNSGMGEIFRKVAEISPVGSAKEAAAKALADAEAEASRAIGGGGAARSGETCAPAPSRAGGAAPGDAAEVA